MAQTLIMNSCNLFPIDINGIHLFCPYLTQLTLNVLKLPAQKQEKLIIHCLKILIQIVGITGNFYIPNIEASKEDIILRTNNQYKEINQIISQFFDIAFKRDIFSGTSYCMSIWITALHILPKKEAHSDYLKTLVQQAFINRFDIDVFDPNNFGNLLLVLDIIELFVTYNVLQANLEISKEINYLIIQLVSLAEDKIPTVGSQLFKKLQNSRNFAYEKVICSIIHLALIMASNFPGITNVN